MEDTRFFLGNKAKFFVDLAFFQLVFLLQFRYTLA